MPNWFDSFLENSSRVDPKMSKSLDKLSRQLASRDRYADLPVGVKRACELVDQPCGVGRLIVRRDAVDDEEQYQAMEMRWGNTDPSAPGVPVWRPGFPLQIVAPSSFSPNKPREVEIEADMIGVCSAQAHPRCAFNDSDVSIGTRRTLKFFRDTELDDWMSFPGIFELLRHLYVGATTPYPIRVDSCGTSGADSPPSSRRVVGLIEVFPADEFELTITSPAAWTKRWRPIGARFKKRTDKRKVKKQFHEDNPNENDCEIELTVSDGPRERSVEGSDILESLENAKKVLKALKKVGQWTGMNPVGFSASFVGDVNAIAGEMSLKWAYREVPHSREVYLWASGAISLVLVSAELTGEFAWQILGKAKVYFSLKIEGELGLEGEIERLGPGHSNTSVKPTGELKGTAELGAKVGCQIVAGALSATCGIELDADEFWLLGRRCGGAEAPSGRIPPEELRNPTAARAAGVSVADVPEEYEAGDARTIGKVFGGKLKFNRTPLIFGATIEVMGVGRFKYTTEGPIEEAKPWWTWDLEKQSSPAPEVKEDDRPSVEMVPLDSSSERRSPAR